MDKKELIENENKEDNQQNSVLAVHGDPSTDISTSEGSNKVDSTQTSNQTNAGSGSPADLKEDYSHNVATTSSIHNMHGILPTNGLVRDILSQILRNYRTIAAEGGMDPDDFYYYHDKSTKFFAIPANPYRANNNVGIVLKIVLKSDYLTSDLSKKVDEYIDKISWCEKSEQETIDSVSSPDDIEETEDRATITLELPQDIEEEYYIPPIDELLRIAPQFQECGRTTSTTSNQQKDTEDEVSASDDDPNNDKEVATNETSQNDTHTESAHIVTLVQALKELIIAVRRLETSSESDNPDSQTPTVQKLQELVNAFDGLNNTARDSHHELAGTGHAPAIDYVLQYSTLVGVSSVSLAVANDNEFTTPVFKYDLLTNNGSIITVTVNSNTITNLGVTNLPHSNDGSQLPAGYDSQDAPTQQNPDHSPSDINSAIQATGSVLAQEGAQLSSPLLTDTSIITTFPSEENLEIALPDHNENVNEFNQMDDSMVCDPVEEDTSQTSDVQISSLAASASEPEEFETDRRLGICRIL